MNMVKRVKVSTFRWRAAGSAKAERFNGRKGGITEMHGPGRLYFDDGSRGPCADYASDPVDVPAGCRASWHIVASGDPYNCAVYELKVEPVPDSN